MDRGRLLVTARVPEREREVKWPAHEHVAIRRDTSAVPLLQGGSDPLAQDAGVGV